MLATMNSFLLLFNVGWVERSESANVYVRVKEP